MSPCAVSVRARRSLAFCTLSQATVAQARQAVELAQDRYDLGLSSVMELSQAQLVQTNAGIQHAAVRYDLQIRRAVLDYEVGTFR